MSSFKRSRAKYVKQTHKITNWPAYDQALVDRGSLTFWFTDEAISKWTSPPGGKAGGQRKYSNLAIETALAFRMVFHVRGTGHVLGRQYSVVTDEPIFGGFAYVMEGINEVENVCAAARRSRDLGREVLHRRHAFERGMIRHVQDLDEWPEPLGYIVDHVPVLDPVLLRVHEFVGEESVFCFSFPASRGAGEWV